MYLTREVVMIKILTSINIIARYTWKLDTSSNIMKSGNEMFNNIDCSYVYEMKDNDHAYAYNYTLVEQFTTKYYINTNNPSFASRH